MFFFLLLFFSYWIYCSSRNISTIANDSSAIISPHHHQQSTSAKKTWSHIAKYNRNLTDAGKLKPLKENQTNSIYKYSNDENGIYMYNSKQGYGKYRDTGRSDEDTMARASQILQ